MTKRQTKSAKKLFNIDGLCYSVNEADHTSACELTRLLSVGADRGNKARKQSFKIGWMHISPEELAANMYSGRKVGLVQGVQVQDIIWLLSVAPGEV